MTFLDRKSVKAEAQAKVIQKVIPEHLMDAVFLKAAIHVVIWLYARVVRKTECSSILHNTCVKYNMRFHNTHIAVYKSCMHIVHIGFNSSGAMHIGVHNR